MFRNWLPWLVTLALTVFLFGEYAYYFPHLPDEVASHFDAQGRPDDSMSKGYFVAFVIGIWVFMLLVLALPMAFIARMPASLINLPHKDYWLAPEQNELSRQYLSRRMAWICAATFLFMACMFHAVLMFNLPPNPPLDLWIPTIIYLLFVVVACTELIWHFSRVPGESAEE